MSAGDKFANSMDKLTGQGKEVLGKVTGDSKTKNEGKGQQTSADAKNKVEDAKGAVKGAVDGLTGKNKH